MVRAVPRAFAASPDAGRAADLADRRRDRARRHGRRCSGRTTSSTRRGRRWWRPIALLVGGGVAAARSSGSALRTGGEERADGPGRSGIGVAQAVALVPGVSRSGATIAAGMALGSAPRGRGAVHLPDERAGDHRRGREGGAGTARHWRSARPTPRLRRRHGDVGGRRLSHREVFIRFLAAHRLDVFAWYRIALCARDFRLARRAVIAHVDWLRRSFITGFFVTVPLVVSVVAIVWVFGSPTGSLRAGRAPGRSARPGLGPVGHGALRLARRSGRDQRVSAGGSCSAARQLLLHVPLFRTVYAPVKQLISAFSPDNESASSGWCWSRTRRVASCSGS